MRFDGSAEAGHSQQQRHRRRRPGGSTQHSNTTLNVEEEKKEPSFDNGDNIYMHGPLPNRHSSSWLVRFFQRHNPPQLPLSNEKSRRRYFHQRFFRLRVMQTILCLSGCVCVYRLLPENSLFTTERRLDRVVRPVFSYEDEFYHVPVRIPSLDVTSFRYRQSDVGGWNVQARFHNPTSPIDWGQPDYNNLVFGGHFGQTRKVNPHDDALMEAEWNRRHPTKKLPKLRPYYQYDEQLEDEGLRCSRANWKLAYRPVCNDIHTYDVSRDFSLEQAKQLGDVQTEDSFYIRYG